MSQEPQEYDEKDLKLEAFRQRLAQLTVEHEDRAADYRVEITQLTQQLQAAMARINELESNESKEEPLADDTAE